MFSFVSKHITHVCGFKRVCSRPARDWIGVSIIPIGQSSNSKGLEWTGIWTHVSTIRTSRKGVYIWNNSKPTHTLFVMLCTWCCIFFPLPGKNKPHEGAMDMRLFLGMLAWLQTVAAKAQKNMRLGLCQLVWKSSVHWQLELRIFNRI
jgi:hypothetical protein